MAPLPEGHLKSPALWVPMVCTDCGAWNRDREGRTLYTDLLRQVPRQIGNPATGGWRCRECVTTREALEALAPRREEDDS